MDISVSSSSIKGHSNFAVTPSKVESIVRDQEGTWAVAKFNGEFLGAFSSGKSGGPSTEESPHAEDHIMAALQAVVDKDGTSDTAVGHLTLKISKSPCIRCADRLILLKGNSPGLTIRIKALGLYFGKSTEDRAGAQLAMSRLMEAGIPVIRWDIHTRFKEVEKGTQGTGALSGNPRARELALADLKKGDFTELEKRKTVQFEGVELATVEQYKKIRDPKATAEIQAELTRKHAAARRAQIPRLLEGLRQAVHAKTEKLNKIPRESTQPRHLWSHLDIRREEVLKEIRNEIAELQNHIRILSQEQADLEGSDEQMEE